MPLVKKVYMLKEMPRVSPVPSVFMACGMKLTVVRVAAA
jgi:hypothetical protein